MCMFFLTVRPHKLCNFNVYRMRICLQVQLLLNLRWSAFLSPFIYGGKEIQRSTLGQLEGCNWIGFCDWIYFFCQSSLSNAVALASLFFLFSVGSLINAIEVIFLLAWLSSLTQGTLWKRSPAFSLSFSLSSILLLMLPHNQMTKILGFSFFSWHIPSCTSHIWAGKSTTVWSLSVFDILDLLWTFVESRPF